MEQHLNITKGNEHPEEWRQEPIDERLLLTGAEYNQIKGSLIRQRIDKGKPDPSAYEIAQACVQYKLAKATPMIEKQERERIVEIYTRYREVLSPKELKSTMLEGQARKKELLE